MYTCNVCMYVCGTCSSCTCSTFDIHVWVPTCTFVHTCMYSLHTLIITLYLPFFIHMCVHMCMCIHVYLYPYTCTCEYKYNFYTYACVCTKLLKLHKAPQVAAMAHLTHKWAEDKDDVHVDHFACVCHFVSQC